MSRGTGGAPRLVALALAAALLAAAPGLAQAAPDAAAPAALRLLLPGRLVAATVAEEGGREVLAVVLKSSAEEGAEEAEAQRRVYVYDPAARTLVPRGGALPDGALELTSDGAAGLWAGVAGFGTLHVLPLTASGASAVAASEGGAAPILELPRRAERTAWGLRLTSPRVHAVAPAAAGEAPCFATEPEAHGRRRLRVLLLCPGREPEELWGLLPGPETITESRFGLLQGAPALAVLSREKLGLFVKQELRVIPLAGSRSRLGTAPILAAHTDCPLWRGSEPSFTDADGDGRADLVVVCRTGLVDQELRVEVYRQRAPDERGGPFETRPRVAKLEGSFGAWHFGADWTGDGNADLLALRDGLLHLHPGAARGRPVETRASRTLALPWSGEEEDEGQVEVRVGTDGGEAREWRGGPEIVAAADLDGDGRPELVVHRAAKDGGELFVLTP